MGNHIYTIGRELGSGGYTVAKLLAERLGIRLYDKELLAQAAKDSGFCEEIFENHDERDPRREADEQFLIFPGNGYIYRWKLFCSTVFGYAA